MSEIVIFNNPEFGEIRTLGDAENPKFCLADVCRVLGLKTKHVIPRLGDEVVSTDPIPDSLGRIQDTAFVSEEGLYDVILDSRKPEAKRFRKWVVGVVLPQIRKTGGYIPSTPEMSEAEIMARALAIAQRTNDAYQQRIRILENQAEENAKEIKLLAPKAEYTDNVLQSNNTYTFTQVAKDLGISSATRLLKGLLQARILYKQSGQYLPYAAYSDCGLFATRTNQYFKADGTSGTSIYTVMTEKGRAYLHTNKEKLLKWIG